MRASAQNFPEDDASPATIADAATAPSGLSGEADEDLLDLAVAAYREGDYQGALDAFNRAYAREPRPELIFNIAQAERHLKRCGAAREHYRQYLEQLPDGPAHAEAKHWLIELESSCVSIPAPQVALAAKPAPASATPAGSSPRREAPPAPGSNRRSVIGWSLVGGGALFGLGSGYFALEALRIQNDIGADFRRTQPLESGGASSFEERGNRGARAAQRARLLLVPAVGLAAVGAWLLLDDATAAQSPPPLSVSAGARGGITADYVGRF